MKRIISIQDISCVGKCSLTVALPIISAMGVETAVLPTAILSTHTAIPGFTFHDLTPEMKPIADHWKREGYSFNAVYTGYLGSFEQIEIVKDFIQNFSEIKMPIPAALSAKIPEQISTNASASPNVPKDALESRQTVPQSQVSAPSAAFPPAPCVFVDPVLGDYGKLYCGFTLDFVREMAKLCAQADVIVPNMTEASYLLGIEYRKDGEYDEEFVKEILRRLCDLGTKNAVLTGTSFTPDRVGFMGFNAEKEEFFSYQTKRIPNAFHGTGDIFASTAVGALMNDFSLCDSLAVAADYTLECIQESLKDPEARTYGVNFETAIPYLIRRIGK